jgi:cellulose synthase/poly-beta-1,6-N-acetylglucosamine synthase-like glycosyltransferase
MPMTADTVFLLSTAAVLALVPGYRLWLRILRPHASPTLPQAPPASARVGILVPVRDEAAWIRDKLHNLAKLVEPSGGLEFWIVDGGSRDGTAEEVETFCTRDARFRLLRDVPGGKIAQLDAALSCCDTDWVLVTDADASMPAHSVIELLANARSADDIGAVGVPVRPHAAHLLERMHWSELNASRAAEARVGSAALVTGPCYLFRRELLPRGFPSGVVADDVHVALTAAAARMRVGFAENVLVTELRSPATIVELFHHKVRKADAYLREVVRFLPLLASFPARARTIFLWRAAQMTLFPAVALAMIVSAAALVAAAGAPTVRTMVVLGAVLFAADSLSAQARGRDPRLAPAAGLAVMLALVLATVLLTMPFARRTAHYPKVGVLRRGTRA